MKQDKPTLQQQKDAITERLATETLDLKTFEDLARQRNLLSVAIAHSKPRSTYQREYPTATVYSLPKHATPTR